MSDREEFIKLNKKLDDIIKQLKDNQSSESERLKILIELLITEYRKLNKDIRHNFSKDSNKYLFRLLDHIITNMYPVLLTDLHEETILFIAAEKELLEKKSKKR